MDIYLFIVVLLLSLGIFGIIVGVSNDAVNFLNSSIGSMVAPRNIIFLVASIGILTGVTFSSGMMEVARKGIFHPKFFTMPELMVAFLAVMLANVLLLDLFNTFSLPTSTTVSIVFSLLGAAVGISLIKISSTGQEYYLLVRYINTAKALTIIMGIILSVGIAFVFGVVIQFITRFIFTFDYEKRMKKYGALWGGTALTTIIFFILLKGARGSSFLTPEILDFIQSHLITILIFTFLILVVILQIIILFTQINILVMVVLAGTFALAMAFAANDLVNFIGVPLAGLNAYTIASSSGDMTNTLMLGMQKKIQTNTFILLASGAVMVATLWYSRKAQSVAKTEVDLSRQDEGTERFDATLVSRGIVRMVSSLFEMVRVIIPENMANKISQRLDIKAYKPVIQKDGRTPSYDLLRASVNLVVASAVVSFATSMKLPLSTTYVTFMVAMGTSLSDQAWDRESAVYRVSGVLTVIAGWFMTAVIAFTVALAFSYFIHYYKVPAIIILLLLTVFLIYRYHHIHSHRAKKHEEMEVFNLIKVTDPESAINTTFEHSGLFLSEVRDVVSQTFDGIFSQNRQELRRLRDESSKIQRWANIIIANTFKILRLLYQADIEHTTNYSHTIGALQEIAESVRDTAVRCYVHVNNNHKGLLDIQIAELKEISECIVKLLDYTSRALHKKHAVNFKEVEKINTRLSELAREFDQNQIKRIQDESSKTRLSILFYGLLGDVMKISEETLVLLNIFHDSFKINKKKRRTN